MLLLFDYGYKLIQVNKPNCLKSENNLILHHGWYLQNLEKDIIRTNMYVHLDGFAKKYINILAPTEITGIRLGINLIFSNLSFCQRVSCEGECAHAHVRCAGIRVRLKSNMKSVCNVCACGSFSGMPL